MQIPFGQKKRGVFIPIRHRELIIHVVPSSWDNIQQPDKTDILLLSRVLAERAKYLVQLVHNYNNYVS